MEKRQHLHFGGVAIEKGAFGTPSTSSANFSIIILILLITDFNHLYRFC